MTAKGGSALESPLYLACSIYRLIDLITLALVSVRPGLVTLEDHANKAAIIGHERDRMARFALCDESLEEPAHAGKMGQALLDDR